MVFSSFPYISSFIGLFEAVLISGLILGGLAIGIIYFCLSAKSLFKATRYVINKDRVDVWEKGFTSKHYSYGMRGYTSMKLDKSGFGNLYDYGKLTLFFMGGSQVELRNIEDPEKVMTQIEEILNAKD
ncbi:hypothetical protein HYV31_02115 [candidate division WWE3 bacterium]|nr:hypothetical protein [candidate division WWE3 bacterium]